MKYNYILKLYIIITMFQKKTSITRNKLYNSIKASKIEIDSNNIDNSINQITKQLSFTKLDNFDYKLIKSPSIYHLESFYRDNSKDKFELKNYN
jgi:transcriptional regulator NrdR family protein